jgi:magnesium chelatase accessory protein
MRWENWPHPRASRFVDSRPHRWHLQEMGEGPAVLLIHGAGAAGTSFRGLLPELAADHRAIAVDLPGHGLTRMGTRQRQGLEAMAADLAALLAQEGIAPRLVVGHSAGAALALRLAELLPEPPAGIVGINAALSPFPGMAGWLFPLMARALAASPLTALAVALTTTEASVRALLRSTGSSLDDEGVALYQRLVTDAGHVEGMLAMMAQWRLEGLAARLPGFPLPVRLIVGEGDRIVPPEVSREAARRLPRAEVVALPGLGHLAHEEAAAEVAAAIREFLPEGAPAAASAR